MKSIIIFIVFIPIICFSKKDSTRFIDNFYLELNPGIGRFTYKEKFANNGFYFYSEKTEKILMFDVDLTFRNKYLRLGFNSNVLLVFDIRFKGGFNILMNHLNMNHYFGAYYSFGQFPNKNQFLYRFKNSNTVGLEYYYKKFHINIGYSWYKVKPESDNIKDLSSIVFNIGYAFNLDSFQKKK